MKRNISVMIALAFVIGANTLAPVPNPTPLLS
jgi:hypothetical protein